MKAHNDLQKIETSLLECIIKAYSADYGRLLTGNELIERKKTIKWIQTEIKSRKKTDPDVLK